MAMPALVSELEEPVEERVAKLEIHVEHIRSDISDMKTDIRRLNDKIDGVDEKLSGKIDAVDKKLSDKFDSVIEILTSLKVGQANNRVWWLLMCAAMLGIMARGFKWL
jgi:predicted  nucleic acid-binding Zn-ribbon protein